MMHRCSNMVGPCTCGLFHSHPNSFSMLFNPVDPNSHYYYNNTNNTNVNTTSSSVDCTLSLAPPSTRLISDHDHRRSTFFRHPNKPSRSAADPLLARRCSNCDTTSTPLWRNGPRGPKSLCNACGIRFKKEERRATAAAASGGAEHQHVFSNKAQKMACYSPAGTDFRFGDDVDGRDSFLSWRLDRPGLVLHDFTRS